MSSMDLESLSKRDYHGEHIANAKNDKVAPYGQWSSYLIPIAFPVKLHSVSYDGVCAHKNPKEDKTIPPEDTNGRSVTENRL